MAPVLLFFKLYKSDHDESCIFLEAVCTRPHTYTEYGDLVALLFPLRKERRGRNYFDKLCIAFFMFITSLEILYPSLRDTGFAASSQICTRSYLYRFSGQNVSKIKQSFFVEEPIGINEIS